MLTKRCPTCARTFAAAQRYCAADGAELIERWADDPRLGTTVLGRYRIEERIGQGGMGVVYRAEQEGVGRGVAVKLVRADRIGNVAAVRRFLREAQTMARLESPHTVKLLDAGTSDEGEPCLVMELLQGETLRARIDAHGRAGVPWRAALPILLGVVRAIAEAHALGLTHRDIKPSNVFLTRTPGYPSGFPKVLDFGIASSHGGAGIDLTGSDEVPGTPVYLAPERITGESSGAPADVYALGVLGWELLAGRPPFSDERPHELLVAHLEHDPPALADVVPEARVPAAFEALLWACLAKAPSQRPPDAGVLLERLEALAAACDPAERQGSVEVPLASTGTDLFAPVTSRVRREKRRSERRRLVTLVATGVVALGLGGGVTWAFTRTAPTEIPTARVTARRLGLAGADGRWRTDERGESLLARPRFDAPSVPDPGLAPTLTQQTDVPAPRVETGRARPPASEPRRPLEGAGAPNDAQKTLVDKLLE